MFRTPSKKASLSLSFLISLAFLMGSLPFPAFSMSSFMFFMNSSTMETEVSPNSCSRASA